MVSGGSRDFKHLQPWIIKDILILSGFLWVGISASGCSEENSNLSKALVKNFPGVPVITLIWIVVKIKLSKICKFHESQSDAPPSYNNVSDTKSGNYVLGLNPILMSYIASKWAAKSPGQLSGFHIWILFFQPYSQGSCRMIQLQIICLNKAVATANLISFSTESIKMV